MPEPALLRRIIRWRWLYAFLAGFRWYRRLHGGRWELRYIDVPVANWLWVDVPLSAPDDYREGLWRGNAAAREVWL